MSITHTIATLQALHAAIPGVKAAPIVYPGQINTADLPLVLVWPGRATTRPVTSKAILQKTERSYGVRVFIDPVGQNNYDAPAQESIGLLQAFLDCYMNNPSLANGYVQITQIDDSGPTAGTAAQTPLYFSGNAYRGFTCELTILEVSK